MTGALTFFVAGTPKAQPRPRAAFFAGRAHIYNPKDADAWKKAVAVAASRHTPAAVPEGGIILGLAFAFKRPASHFRTGKNAGLVKSSAPKNHTSKPDLDNLAKAVMDTLTKSGFWRDDSQVTQLHASKEWADKSEGCDIIIWPVIG